MLWRDDDISVTTDATLLVKIHELFVKYHKTHTVAVQMKDIWENKEVWYFLMTAPNLNIGLHGWEHTDYSRIPRAEIKHELSMALDYWNFMIARGNYEPKPLSVFYPPWNKINEDLVDVCKELGLRVDNRVGGDVFNFHSWEFIYPERLKHLEASLAL